MPKSFLNIFLLETQKTFIITISVLQNIFPLNIECLQAVLSTKTRFRDDDVQIHLTWLHRQCIAIVAASPVHRQHRQDTGDEQTYDIVIIILKYPLNPSISSIFSRVCESKNDK